MTKQEAANTLSAHVLGLYPRLTVVDMSHAAVQEATRMAIVALTAPEPVEVDKKGLEAVAKADADSKVVIK